MKQSGFVDILGKPYSVVFKSETDMHSNMGTANRDKQVIFINNESATEQQEDSLLHEVVHMIDIELKIGLSEENVSRLAVGLHSAGLRVKVR